MPRAISGEKLHIKDLEDKARGKGKRGKQKKNKEERAAKKAAKEKEKQEKEKKWLCSMSTVDEEEEDISDKPKG